MTVEDVKRRLKDVHGDVVTLIESTFTNGSSTAMFNDKEHGIWTAKVGNVLNSKSTHPKRGLLKRKSTWLGKYGVDNPFKSDAVQAKAVTGRRKVHRLVHWETGQELVCVGSYEYAFVNWCNATHVSFNWQINHRMPSGRRYRIDAFIKTGDHANTWIEIKGYFRDADAREKWDWFHTTHANSQLWDLHKLTALGILVKKKPNPMYVDPRFEAQSKPRSRYRFTPSHKRNLSVALKRYHANR
jgi:hypothetical protein